MYMGPNLERATQEAESVREKYNSEGISPFPYENVLRECSDLRILSFDISSDNISGATDYDKESKIFTIYN